MSAPHDSASSDHRLGGLEGTLESIAVEMGHKLARMSYSSIIRESEDFGCVICDGQGDPAGRVVADRPLATSGRASTGVSPSSARKWRPGDVIIHNHRTYWHLTWTRCRFRRPDLPQGRAGGVLRHHRAPPRSWRAHPRLVRGSSTHRTDTYAKTQLQRESRRRAGPSQQVVDNVSGKASSSLATWRRRSPPADRHKRYGIEEVQLRVRI